MARSRVARSSLISSGAITGSIARTYNTDFRPITFSVNGGALPVTYDKDGLITQAGSLTLTRNLATGFITATTLGQVTTSQGYNTFGELSQLGASYGVNSLFNTTHTRDAVGRIVTKTETIQGQTDSYSYGYDTTGRLVGVSKNGTLIAQYIYDNNGNRSQVSFGATTLTATYDDQDRLTNYGGVTYNYTANGELQSKTSNGQTTSYGYDVLGNLKTVTLPDTTAIEYVIDGRNRRIGKKVNGVLTQGFLYQDQLKPIAELDGNNTVTARFVYATKINVPEYMVKGGISYRIISDHLGSPRLVINTTDGTVAQRMDYDEFGNVTLDSNPGFQPFGFAGGLLDQHTKLTRFGARDYDAQTGRWTAKDPIRFAGGDTNLYGYTFNDPVNLIDPRGQGALLAGIAIGVGLATVKIGPVIYDAIQAANKSNEANENFEKFLSDPNSVDANSLQQSQKERIEDAAKIAKEGIPAASYISKPTAQCKLK